MEDTTTAIAAALSQVGRLGADEAAEFDIRVPHWLGSTGDQPAKILSLFGPQGREHASPSEDCRQERFAE